MVEMTGVIMALKKKGLVFDDEISQAISDARSASVKTNSVQSTETGKDEDSSGHGRPGILRTKSTNPN
jgi:hypothetical protein